MTTLRDEFLIAVAEHPIHDWPGPPKGLENVPSCSYMGPYACKRKAYYRIMSQQGLLRGYEEPKATPERGGNDLPAQRGWLLEDSVRHWLDCNGVEIDKTHPDLYVVGPNRLYYGHPDGLGTCNGVNLILEIKHQNAMRYMDFLRFGLENMTSTYYAQVQGYMLATGLKQTLLIALASDPSSVKGDITWGKRKKNYAGQLEPGFKAVPNCSGVNPFVYLELVQANDPFQKAWVIAWAKEIKAAAEVAIAPERTFDLNTDWQCRAEWCDFRAICEKNGGLQAAASVTYPQVEKGVSRE